MERKLAQVYRATLSIVDHEQRGVAEVTDRLETATADFATVHKLEVRDIEWRGDHPINVTATAGKMLAALFSPPELTHLESSLILYLADCTFNKSGRVNLLRMNEEDMDLVEAWVASGLIEFGRIAFKDITTDGGHWVRLSPAAFRLHEKAVRERAARMWANRRFKTTEEKRVGAKKKAESTKTLTRNDLDNIAKEAAAAEALRQVKLARLPSVQLNDAMTASITDGGGLRLRINRQEESAVNIDLTADEIAALWEMLDNWFERT